MSQEVENARLKLADALAKYNMRHEMMDRQMSSNVKIPDAMLDAYDYSVWAYERAREKYNAIKAKDTK